MELPEDVIRIISAFSKPLQRIRVGCYWTTQTLEEMIEEIMIKYENYVRRYCLTYSLEHTTSPKWTIRAWTNGEIHSTLCFTKQEIFDWDGKSFECRSVTLSNKFHLTAAKISTYLCNGDKKIRLLKSNRPYPTNYRIYPHI